MERGRLVVPADRCRATRGDPGQGRVGAGRGGRLAGVVGPGAARSTRPASTWPSWTTSALVGRPAARKALDWLAARQRADGTWDEDEALAAEAPAWARAGDPEARLCLTASAGVLAHRRGLDAGPPGRSTRASAARTPAWSSRPAQPSPARWTGRAVAIVPGHRLAGRGGALPPGLSTSRRGCRSVLERPAAGMSPADAAWLAASLRRAGSPRTIGCRSPPVAGSPARSAAMAAGPATTAPARRAHDAGRDPRQPLRRPRPSASRRRLIRGDRAAGAVAVSTTHCPTTSPSPPDARSPRRSSTARRAAAQIGSRGDRSTPICP